MRADRIQAVQGDITTMNVTAVVNAANSFLRKGGGVCGAIHAAAGPTLEEACQRQYPSGCPTGGAVHTSGCDLKAPYVIHAVGPVWKDGANGEPEALGATYRSILKLATESQFMSIAIPAISTGIYGFPAEQARRIAFREVRMFLSQVDSSLTQVSLVAFDDRTFKLYEEGVALSETELLALDWLRNSWSSRTNHVLVPLRTMTPEGQQEARAMATGLLKTTFGLDEAAVDRVLVAL